MGARLVVLRTPDGVAPLDDVALGPALLAMAQAGAGLDQSAAAGAAAASGAPAAGTAAGAAAVATLRLAWPRPTLAFSRLDTLAPGYPDAIAAARAHGFEPVVRQRGGRAAAYHEGCLLLDLVSSDPDPRAGIRARYTATAELLAGALTDLGVDARVGPVPGEYCPGDFSVNAGGRVKLAGLAQRVVRAAWLVSAVLVVRDADRLRAVLTDVYAALGLEWQPRTVGSLDGVLPLGVAGGVPAGVGRDAVERAVLRRLAAGQLPAGTSPSGPPPAIQALPWPADLLAAARLQHDRHRPT